MNAFLSEAPVERAQPPFGHHADLFPLHELFEQHAHCTPNAPALTVGDETVSYAKLNALANHLATKLSVLTVAKQAHIGICMHRCVEMIVSVLAVLKAGASYVPIDASYPEQRQQRMLSALPFTAVLVTAETKGAPVPPGVPVLEIDQDLEEIDGIPAQRVSLQVSGNDLAYVVFTSGSTGEPKAAGVAHRGWSNLLHWFTRTFQISSSDRVLIISSFGFDITQRSIMMPLAVGAHLILMSGRHFEPNAVLDTIQSTQSTIINCAPSMFYPLIERGTQRFPAIASLRLVFLGGEAISASRLRAWAESNECNSEIVNVYGVAECSDVSTYHVLKNYPSYISSSVPLGLPIFNSQVSLLDEQEQPVEAGEIGEICISGWGVGVGYVNDAQLTARKFVFNSSGTPSSPVLYKTGDLGRIDTGGRLEYRGRKDFQVKVNGVRLELGEVETALRQHPIVREAVAIIREYGEDDRRLVAFITLQRNMESIKLIQTIRLQLSDRLPLHMVPGEIFAMEDLPLNPNGKIDRKALQEVDLTALRPKQSMDDRPRTETEKQIAQIFASVLHLEKVGVNDNFFHLGGTSYLLTEAVAEIAETITRKVTILDFLAQPDVAGLAQVIDRIKRTTLEGVS